MRTGFLILGDNVVIASIELALDDSFEKGDDKIFEKWNVLISLTVLAICHLLSRPDHQFASFMDALFPPRNAV